MAETTDVVVGGGVFGTRIAPTAPAEIGSPHSYAPRPDRMEPSR